MKYFLALLLSFSLCCTVWADQTFVTAILPDDTRLRLEVADTPDKMMRGLMFRKELAPKSGMVFIYKTERFPSIWMKNCYIYLDILWLSSEGRIVYFVENVPPCHKNVCPTYEPLSKSKYVIETNAHTIKKHQMKVGDRINLIH